MAFDPNNESLATRVRTLLSPLPNVDEKRMFGGICFLLRGHMLCGVTGERLMARLGVPADQQALQEPHVRPMAFTGRVMKGFVYVDPPGLTEDSQLGRWLKGCIALVDTLPGKPMVPKPAAKKAASKKAASKKASKPSAKSAAGKKKTDRPR